MAAAARTGALVAANIAAALKASVTLVEAHRMGGDCLNTGCVPSKALIRVARAAHEIRSAHTLGIADAQGRVDFAAVMARVRVVIRAIEPHDSVERYTGLGVEVLQGHAVIRSPWSVQVTTPAGTQVLTTRAIVVAAGAAPTVPPIPGLREAGCLTSDTVWDLAALPARLVVLGGGAVGCELAQCFARLGAQVTLLEQAPRVLAREDADASTAVATALYADGVQVLAGHEVVRVDVVDGQRRVVARHAGGEVVLRCDEILCALGRTPRVTGYGLEDLGVALTPRSTIATDAFQRTNVPTVYAVGDVAGPLAFTHVAGYQGWHAAVSALFGGLRQLRVDLSAVPWCTYTSPEVARVGLSEDEARAQGIACEVTRFDLAGLDRALVDGTPGFVQVLTVPGKDTILGATIVGDHAGELITEYTLAMKHGLGLNALLAAVRPYPTLADAGARVAGEWKRAHAPQGALKWLQRFHAWRRS